MSKRFTPAKSAAAKRAAFAGQRAAFSQQQTCIRSVVFTQTCSGSLSRACRRQAAKAKTI